MNQFFYTLIFSSFAGFATIMGIVLILYWEKWARKNSIYLVSFAAGTLLAGAFFHMIPESIKLYKNSFLTVLLGFLLFYILEHSIMAHSCREERCEEHTFGRVALLGLGFHSFLDGIAIGVGFEINTTLGIVTTLAVLLHEVPEGISSMAVMFHARVETRIATLYSVLVAVATPLGAVFAFFFVKNLQPWILGVFLSMAAGSFIYIAASDLIPETHKNFRVENSFILFFGIAFIYLVSFLLP